MTAEEAIDISRRSCSHRPYICRECASRVVREMIAAEREACASLCDTAATDLAGTSAGTVEVAQRQDMLVSVCRRLAGRIRDRVDDEVPEPYSAGPSSSGSR